MSVTHDQSRLNKVNKSVRERQIVHAVLANLGDSDFDFETLCERFAQDSPEAISYVLQKHGLRWNSIDQSFDRSGRSLHRRSA